MAGYTLIGGSAHKITGGKAMVGGAVKSISNGKTMVGGAVKDISFGNNIADFVAIMQTANSANIVGRNTSSTSGVNISLSNANVHYCFAFCDGHMSITKYVNQVITPLFHTSSTMAWVYASGRRVGISNNGGESATADVYGGTLFECTFGTTYTEAQIDAVFSTMKFVRGAGDNTSAGGAIYFACPENSLILGAYNTMASVYYPVTTKIYDAGLTSATVVYTNNTAYLYNSDTSTKLRGSLIQLS